MISLQEFFNRPEHAQAKGIVQKNNIIKRNIIAHMAIAGDSTLADLAKKLHISIPTVTKLVEELLAENIIADRGKIETSGGRRPNVYGLTNSAIYFAGIEVSRDQIVLVITDLQNNIIQSERKSDFALDDTDECLETLLDDREFPRRQRHRPHQAAGYRRLHGRPRQSENGAKLQIFHS